jgi:hypothetical protein
VSHGPSKTGAPGRTRTCDPRLRRRNSYDGSQSCSTSCVGCHAKVPCPTEVADWAGWLLNRVFVNSAAFFAGNTQCQRRRVAQSTSCSCLDLPLVSTLPSVLSSVVGVANDSVIQTAIPHAALRWARPSTRAAPEAVMRRAPWQAISLRPSAAFGDHQGRCRRAARGRASPKPTRTESQ